MSQDNEAIDTNGTSVRDMSAEDIDAVLDELGASAGEGPVRTEDEPTEMGADSAVATEATERAGPDQPPPAAGEPTTQAEPPAAPDPEVALERVDEDLADLEKMLADTIAEVDGESSAGAFFRQPEAADEGSGEQAEPETFPEASACPAAENEPPTEAAGSGSAAPADGSEQADSPPAEPQLATPAPQDGDQGLEPASPEPDQPNEEMESPEIPAPSRARARIMLTRPGRGLAAAAATALALMDAPFADVSQKTKTMLGYVGIATLLVALATWIAGSVVPLP